MREELRKAYVSNLGDGLIFADRNCRKGECLGEQDLSFTL